MKKLILASTSLRRKEILKKAGISFVVERSGYTEDMTLKMKPRALAKYLALGKARAVAARHKAGLVLGTDTIVVCEGQIIGKPESPVHARASLKFLSGKKHEVITGFALVNAKTGRSRARSVTTRVWFRKLSGREIGEYIKTGEAFGAAGAYTIQGKASEFVKRVRGGRDNVVGLPLTALKRELKKFGVR